MEWIENYGPQLLYWALTGVVGAFAVWVWRKIKSQKVEQDAIEEGVKAILHDRIYQAHHYYIERGYCPLDDKKNIEYLYRPYARLGGNGTGKQAYEEIMGLPTEPEKED